MTVLRLCLGLCAALLALPAAAEDTALLIQIRPDGRYTVWYAGGQTPLGDDEIGALEASARPEGGRSMLTAAGLAQAFETPNGVLIRLPALGPDRSLLIDHDGCGGIKVWHDRGDVNLTEDELTELVLSALPARASEARYVATNTGRAGSGASPLLQHQFWNCEQSLA